MTQRPKKPPRPRKPKAGPTRSEDRVVRRPREERRGLDPELEPLARGEQERLRRPPGRPRLRDDRPVALVPGVANRDARAVHDQRLARLQTAIGQNAEALARGLAEAVRLRLWRGRSITGFDAWVEQLLGLDPREARALAKEGAQGLEMPCEPASEEAVAVWMRAEAALLEAGLEAEVRCRGADRGETFELRTSVDAAPPVLSEVGRRVAPLARDREPQGEGREARDREARRKPR